MKYIRNFDSVNAAKKATLYSPAVTKVTENKESVLLNKDLGFKDQKLKIGGSSLDNLEFKCFITGEWTYKSTNKDKVLIKGEVTLNSKVDCYSIEFMDSTSHLTIEAGARLRIWEGGIVNDDCSTVNYFTIYTTNGTSYSITSGELLLHPNIVNNINPLGSINLLLAVVHSSQADIQIIGIPTHIKPSWAADKTSPTAQSHTVYFNKFDTNNGWQVIYMADVKNPFVGSAFWNNISQSGSRYILTGNIILNENYSTSVLKGYTLFANSYAAKISTKKLYQLYGEFNILRNDTHNFFVINNSNIETYKYIYPYTGFFIQSEIVKTITFNYKDLVWDPSFEEETSSSNTPVLTMMSSSSLNNGLNSLALEISESSPINFEDQK